MLIPDFEECVLELVKPGGDKKYIKQCLKYHLQVFQDRINYCVEQRGLDYTVKRDTIAIELFPDMTQWGNKNLQKRFYEFFGWVCGWQLDRYAEEAKARLKMMLESVGDQRRLEFTAAYFARWVNNYAN